MSQIRSTTACSSSWGTETRQHPAWQWHLTPEPFWSPCNGDTKHQWRHEPSWGGTAGGPAPESCAVGQEVAQADLALTPSRGEGCGCWVLPRHGTGCLHQQSARLNVGCHLSMGLLGMGWVPHGRDVPHLSTLPHTLLAPCSAASPSITAHPLHQSRRQASRERCKPRGAEFHSRAGCFGPSGVFPAGISEHGDGGHKPQLLLPSCHFHAPQARHERAATCFLPCPRCLACSCRSWNSSLIIKHE